MSATQKAAWFNLMVVALTATVVLTLYPMLGARASGGFGVLGFVGLAALFYRRQRGRAVSDERDVMIYHRANVWAYTVLWVCFVASALAAPAVFGDSVPVAVIQSSVWVAFMIVLGVHSIATLVQHGRAIADGN